MNMTFLIDGDNHVLEGLNGSEMLSADDSILVFHKKGASLNKIKIKLNDCSAYIEYMESAKDGKNSVDFQIIAELGIMVGRKDVEYAYIISQDKGYEAPIAYLRKKHTKSFREISLNNSIEECLKLSFVLKSDNIRDLHNAFVREYGIAQGSMLYTHLKALFKKTDEPTPVKELTETKEI